MLHVYRVDRDVHILANTPEPRHSLPSSAHLVLVSDIQRAREPNIRFSEAARLSTSSISCRAFPLAASP